LERNALLANPLIPVEAFRDLRTDTPTAVVYSQFDNNPSHRFMNIQQFIKEAIVQIAKGIEDAEKELKQTAAIVNPRYVATSKAEAVYGYMISEKEKDREKYRAAVQTVEFDVAVYAAESTETRGGIGLMVGTIGLGTQGATEKGNRSESRIRFSIPVAFPFSEKLPKALQATGDASGS
jgi:hypothetical protein